MSVINQTTNITLIDTLPVLVDFLDSITNLPVDPPPLYFDLEGVNLDRSGSVSLVSLYVAPQAKTYIIDVHVLRGDAFSTLSTRTGCSLTTILEDPNIPKVFFDCRNDSDALFSHYKISLDGTIDIQLLELATRKGCRDLVHGLAKCIQYDSTVSKAVKETWQKTKEDVNRLFDASKGGSYEVFNERPIRQDILRYSANDVELLPNLWEVYSTKLRKPDKGVWRWMIQKETQNRIKQSQGPRYNGQSKSKICGPWDKHTIENEIEAWNDDVLLMAVHDGMVLNEDDEWVNPPQKSAKKSSVFTLAARMSSK
jgi:exonuclease 3'-5' domain-containing protein 1